MPCPLISDCLDKVFEYLEEDKTTLRSCLLVNRLWCKVSVRILWRNIWNFIYLIDRPYIKTVASAILGTLIACLPNDSEELIKDKIIFIKKPTLKLKPPLFNYPTFCKVLSIDEIIKLIAIVFKYHNLENILVEEEDYTLVVKEIIKMFMNQIYSLKTLNYYYTGNDDCVISIEPFTYFPDYLKYLSGLSCGSNIDSEFFYQLSQICHNLQSLTIVIREEFSNGLKELISSQNNLKKLNLLAYEKIGCEDALTKYWTDILPALTKHSNTLTRLHLDCWRELIPLSFVSLFLNLQVIIFTINDFNQIANFGDFKKLQYFTFPKLQSLKIHFRRLYKFERPGSEPVKKFLEINGKNLKELYTEYNMISLSIANFCPNLKKLFVNFHGKELDALETIFNCCQHLESIGIYHVCSLSRVLEVVAKHSPKTLYELKLCCFYHSGLRPKDLESFFVSWDDRIPKKSLSLIIVGDGYSNDNDKNNIKIIEKYKNLGIIRYKIKKILEEEKDCNENHHLINNELEYKLLP